MTFHKALGHVLYIGVVVYLWLLSTFMELSFSVSGFILSLFCCDEYMNICLAFFEKWDYKDVSSATYCNETPYMLACSILFVFWLPMGVVIASMIAVFAVII